MSPGQDVQFVHCIVTVAKILLLIKYFPLYVASIDNSCLNQSSLGWLQNDFSRPTHLHFAHLTIITRHSAFGKSFPFSTIYTFLHLFMIGVDWSITVFSVVYNSLWSLIILVLKWADLAKWTLFVLKLYVSCVKLSSLLLSHSTVSYPEIVYHPVVRSHLIFKHWYQWK